MDRVLIVPAAGRGSRLGTSQPKALVPVAGRPMLDHLLERHWGAVDRVILIVAPAAIDAVDRYVRASTRALDVVVQPEATGMLDAILVARPLVAAWQPSRIAITWCDQIALGQVTAARVVGRARAADAPALVFPTFVLDAPYIHFDRDASGRIEAVRQRREGDAMPPRGESDMGLFDLSLEAYAALDRFAAAAVPGRATGERNFLPFIPWLAASHPVETVAGEAAIETVGINTPEDLALVERYLARRPRS